MERLSQGETHPMSKQMRTMPLAVLLIALMSWSSPAAAQDILDDSAIDPTRVNEALDLYWAQKREIRAIHSRMFRKEGRHEFSLGGGIVPNDEFYSYFPVGGRWNYYFNEDFSSEIFGSYVIPQNSDLKDFLETRFRQAMLVDIPQQLQWTAGATVVWSPIHGKIALFTSKLAHFDLFVAMGAGVIGTEIRELSTTAAKQDVTGILGLGFRFYLTDWLSVRMDYRQFFYPAEVGGVAHPVELTMGVSFWTTAPQ